MKIIPYLIFLLFFISCTTTQKTKLPLATIINVDTSGNSTLITTYSDSTVGVVHLNKYGENVDTVSQIK